MTKEERDEIDAKLQLLNHELSESRTYFKVALATLLLILLAFFTEKSFLSYLMENKVFAVFILVVITLLVMSLVYLLTNIFLFNKHDKDELNEDEKDSNRDWTE
ncbi:hypothetical protein C0585_06490 [Candidatus Woesearchaeota archaeon]|nr:MAG: hypothetical protein C0585_06490 [Candidatus Woesearchaeota archaeon]